MTNKISTDCLMNLQRRKCNVIANLQTSNLISALVTLFYNKLAQFKPTRFNVSKAFLLFLFLKR